MKLQAVAVAALLAMSTSVVCAQTTPGQKPAAQPAGGQNGLNTTQQKASYAIGIGVAESIKSDQLDLDQAALIKGITDGMNGVKPPLSDQEMSEAVQQFQKDQVAKISDKNKKEGAKFLAENKTKEGVKTTPSGLQYKVIKSGSGATPGPTDEVTAHYKGTLLDGKVFDSSYDRGQPIHLRADKVIKGWSEAMQMMKVGDKWQLFIPSELAYGEGGAGSTIGPNAVLVFDVELLDVKKGGAGNPLQLQPLNSSK
jgi:FKBP-type peptidyl-prolyl cis-trans isomerase FklB